MIGHRAALLLSVCALTLSGCGLKPQPLTPQAISSYAGDKLARYGQGEEPIAGAIGLDEAIARGLRYNLDYRVEAFQSALRTADLEVADFHLLPNVVASSNYLGRDNNLAAYSQSVTTGQVTLIPSVSVPLSSGKLSVLIAATSTFATSTNGAGSVTRMPGSSVSEYWPRNVTTPRCCGPMARCSR